MTEWSAACPNTENEESAEYGYPGSCVAGDATRRGNKGGRAGKAESARTSVASRNSGLGQTNWLPGNHFHRTEGLGLELHGRLFETGARRGGRPRTLVL